MTPTAKLALGIAIMVAVTSYMAWVGAATSWRYYVTVDECVERHVELTGSRVRVSGRVAVGSLQVNPERSLATFVLQGMQECVDVTGIGPFPDNLEEDIEVVVEGTLEPGGVLRAERVLTKCASKYEEQRAGGASAPRYGAGGKESP